jgi:hypothetical protein
VREEVAAMSRLPLVLLFCVALLAVTTPCCPPSAQETMPAYLKPYIGKWRSRSPENDRASFTIVWEDGKLRVTQYTYQSDRTGRVDLTSTIKMEKASLGGGYTISGGRTSPGFQIRNIEPKGDTLVGEVLFGGGRNLTTYEKDE